MHNPRAEAAKEAGCDHAEFVELMRQDDAMDADLTELGEKQARSVEKSTVWGDHALQLVVSSPLSRALLTADLAVPPMAGVKRVAVEDFREINGMLLNGKRRNVDELEKRFPSWDFGEIAQTDELWTDTLETHPACAERGYLGFCWLTKRPEERILLACHGGILRFTMQDHPLVKIVDKRTAGDLPRAADARFGNCEIRKYELGVDDIGKERPTIILTEVDANAEAK